jgi:hypothetical protein
VTSQLVDPIALRAYLDFAGQTERRRSSWVHSHIRTTVLVRDNGKIKTAFHFRRGKGKKKVISVNETDRNLEATATTVKLLQGWTDVSVVTH